MSAKANGIPVASIKKLVEYLYRDEETHFEGGKERNHIFRSVKKVADWLDEINDA
jgi:hypothetical protein